MKEHSLYNLILINAVRWWLIFILIIIPFHFSIFTILESWNNELSNVFNRLDEGTLVILFPLALREIYRKKDISDWSILIILFSIIVLSFLGFISGMLNGNSLLITMLGIFHYVKYFLFIFIYAAFLKDFNDFKKIFRLLLIVAVFIGFVAFVEEVWALYIRYVYGKDINENGMVLLISNVLGVKNVILSSPAWRFGIYRASLLFHYNLLGLYSLFILTFYLYTAKKVNYVVLFSLLTGIFASVSRTAYTGFALLAGLQIFKGRRWFIVFMFPIVFVLFFMFFWGSASDYQILQERREEFINENMAIQSNDEVSFRYFARQKAMNVWKDHPMWGVGPGMFGGDVAYKYRSPYYEEYNCNIILNWFHSLEQLWPQALAEMGIVGTAALAGLFVSLLAIFYNSRQQASSDEQKDLFSGLLTFTLIFLIYTLSGNLNIVSIMVPFCAFAGMGLGSKMSG